MIAGRYLVENPSEVVFTLKLTATAKDFETLRDHDPDGTPVPIIVPYATDAKHTAALGVLAYGFSPLRLAPREPFLELWHGVDERVGVEALRWGLPVLYDVVRRFCA